MEKFSDYYKLITRFIKNQHDYELLSDFKKEVTIPIISKDKNEILIPTCLFCDFSSKYVKAYKSKWDVIAKKYILEKMLFELNQNSSADTFFTFMSCLGDGYRYRGYSTIENTLTVVVSDYYDKAQIGKLTHIFSTTLSKKRDFFSEKYFSIRQDF